MGELPDCLASVPMASLRSLQFGGKFMEGGIFGVASIRMSSLTEHVCHSS